jgi:4,5:9,10-diseco-3-hydroxy-5,9,17-trioxoandrosta-1(10),2-diene-4-oate hydrolase
LGGEISESSDFRIQDLYAQVNGARVHYQRAGTGPPLLLIHGIVGSCAIWRWNIDTLARHATVYAIDLLNMGESERLSGLDAGLEATADRLGMMMDALELHDADIAAHSHGGAIALMFAARHAERVRSLILFAPANPYSHCADWMVRFHRSWLGRILAPLYTHAPEWMQSIALRRMYGEPRWIVPGCLEDYLCGLRVLGTIPHILRIVDSWFSDMEQLEAALPRASSTPALLIWGNRDRAVSLESGLELQKVLKGSTMHMFPRAGHVVFQERADETNALMVEWLTRLASMDVGTRSFNFGPQTSPRSTRASPPASG